MELTVMGSGINCLRENKERYLEEVASVDRFLIPSDGPDQQAIRTALGEVITYCRELPKPISVVFLTPGMEVQNTVLAEVIGESAAKDLEKNRPIKLVEGLPVIHESIRTFDSCRAGHIILGLWPNRRMLDLIDAAISARAAFVIPWSMDEVQPWLTTWNPRVIGQEPAAPQEVVTNQIVRKGLEALTRRVNLATGLNHPNDRDAAVALFKLFVRERLPFDPDGIRAWALRNGWAPGHADQLVRIASDIAAGEHLRCNSPQQWNLEYLRRDED